MKLSSSLLALLAFGPLTASAVTITIDADILKNASGSPMSQSGLVILTAATDGVFHGPSGTNFVTGDEMLLYSWDLSAFGMDGVLSDLTTPLSFSGAWDQDDPLRIYWFPTLTLASAGPTPGIPYGYYSDSVGVDGSAPWITPAETDNISLAFFTSDSTLVTGSNDPDAGLASEVVPQRGGPAALVPDHGSTLTLTLVSLAGIGIARRIKARPRRG